MSYQTLLNAIIQAPDDEAPYLVCADWLMDQGDPRGEFILIQCTLGRPLYGASGYVLRNHPDAKEPLSREELEAREKKLLKKHQKAWVAPFRTAIRTWSWQRGFVNRIVADAAKFLQGTSLVFDNTPLTELELTALKPKLLEELAALPELSRIRTLYLGQQRIDAKTAHFFHSEHLSGVRELNIWGNPLGEDGTKILARARHLDSLRSLHLTTTQQTPAGLDELTRSEFFPRLTNLDLRFNDNLDASVGPMLARGASLTRLRIPRVPIDADGLELLARGAPLLEELHVSSGNFGQRGIEVLCDPSNFKNLRVLQGIIGYSDGVQSDSPEGQRLRERFGDGLC